MLLATMGTMTVNTVVLKLSAYFGGGDAYTQRGWTIAMTIMSVAFTAISFLTFWNCKKRVVQEDTKGSKDDVPEASVIDSLKSLIKRILATFSIRNFSQYSLLFIWLIAASGVSLAFNSRIMPGRFCLLG